MERKKLFVQLRERAIEIGEKGIRFLGMDSNQIAQVMEFASNLRQGIVDLPLNDRSKDLMVSHEAFLSIYYGINIFVAASHFSTILCSVSSCQSQI